MVEKETRIDRIIHRLLYYEVPFKEPISSKKEAQKEEIKLQHKGWLRLNAILYPKQSYSDKKVPSEMINITSADRYLKTYLSEFIESKPFDYKPKRKPKRGETSSKRIYRLKQTKNVFNKLWLGYLTKRNPQLFVDSDYYAGMNGEKLVRELYFNFLSALMNRSSQQDEALKMACFLNYENRSFNEIALHIAVLEPALKIFIEDPNLFKLRIQNYHHFLQPLLLTEEEKFHILTISGGLYIFFEHIQNDNNRVNHQEWFRNLQQVLLADIRDLLRPELNPNILRRKRMINKKKFRKIFKYIKNQKIRRKQEIIMTPKLKALIREYINLRFKQQK